MTQNESELQLQAILYLLDDPSLDRLAFEARLADDDGQLAEILANSVLLVQQLKFACGRQNGDSKLCAAPIALASARSSNEQGAWSHPLTKLASLAASLMVVVSIAWWFSSTQDRIPPAWKTSELVQDEWDPFSSSTLLDGVDLDSVVLAWSDMHSGEQEDHGLPMSLATRDCLVLSTDWSDEEVEFPDWMLLAASVGRMQTTEGDVN